MLNKEIKIIAGPCSVDRDNINDIVDIANIEIENKRVIYGVRMVGLKSRTALDISGNGMGMDFEAYMKNIKILSNGGKSSDFIDLPSILLSKELQKKQDILVASEIVDVSIQMPLLERHLKNGKVMTWNPSVNQLGWPILNMSKYCERNNWLLGIKNAKNLGDHLNNSEEANQKTSLDKVWEGLVRYSQMPTENKVLIHRGVDVPEKGDFRNALVHNLAKRVKLATSCKLYFDPSHSYGPKLRDKIPEGIINALRTKIDDCNYLYDGALIESGISKTDTDQHLTVKELKDVLKEVSKFRDLSTK